MFTPRSILKCSPSLLKPSPFPKLNQRALTRGFSTAAATPASTGLKGTTPTTKIQQDEDGSRKSEFHEYTNDLPIRLHSASGQYATLLYKSVITAALKSEHPGKILQGAGVALDRWVNLVNDPEVAQVLSEAEDPEVLKKWVDLVSDKAGYSWGSFIKTLAQQKQLSHLREIAEDYDSLISRLLQKYTIQVSAASESEVPSSDTLKAILALPPKAALNVDVQIDKALIGGFVATTNEVYVDRSLKPKVAALQAAIVAARSAQIDKEYKAIFDDIASS
jgi:F0F1-type ATP synthase delta subunit